MFSASSQASHPPHCGTGTSDHQPDPLRPFGTHRGPSSGPLPSAPSAWTLSPPTSAGPPTAGTGWACCPVIHSPLSRSWFPLPRATTFLGIRSRSCLRINTMKFSAWRHFSKAASAAFTPDPGSYSLLSCCPTGAPAAGNQLPDAAPRWSQESWDDSPHHCATANGQTPQEGAKTFLKNDALDRAFQA